MRWGCTGALYVQSFLDLAVVMSFLGVPNPHVAYLHRSSSIHFVKFAFLFDWYPLSADHTRGIHTSLFGLNTDLRSIREDLSDSCAYSRSNTTQTRADVRTLIMKDNIMLWKKDLIWPDRFDNAGVIRPPPHRVHNPFNTFTIPYFPILQFSVLSIQSFSLNTFSTLTQRGQSTNDSVVSIMSLSVSPSRTELSFSTQHVLKCISNTSIFGSSALLLSFDNKIYMN